MNIAKPLEHYTRLQGAHDCWSMILLSVVDRISIDQVSNAKRVESPFGCIRAVPDRTRQHVMRCHASREDRVGADTAIIRTDAAVNVVGRLANVLGG